MEVLGGQVVLSPETTLRALAFVLLGVLIGTVSGLTPGIHANNFALVLAAAVPSIPGPPTMVGVAMLAAGVVHTFLDVIPAIALGVPDAAMAATALPGHKLVIEGRGGEALRLSALGSGLAVLFAVPLAIPITAGMVELYPVIRPHLSVVLAALAVFLVTTESSREARIGGGVSFAASAGLGLALLDYSPDAPLDAGGMLAPLFAGLFGAPVLVDAMGGAGIPRQDDPVITIPRSVVWITALVGTVAGAIVGYLPGVSSAVAAVVVFAVFPTLSGARGFVVATSGVNTSNTIFALFALVALGSPRTGVLVALNDAGVPLNLPLLLTAVGIASAAGFVLVTVVGDRYLRAIRRIDYTRLSVGVLGGLVIVAYLFAGFAGVGAFVVASLLGLIPPRLGAKRVHLMGVLIGPLVVG